MILIHVYNKDKSKGHMHENEINGCFALTCGLAFLLERTAIATGNT